MPAKLVVRILRGEFIDGGAPTGQFGSTAESSIAGPTRITTQQQPSVAGDLESIDLGLVFWPIHCSGGKCTLRKGAQTLGVPNPDCSLGTDVWGRG